MKLKLYKQKEPVYPKNQTLRKCFSTCPLCGTTMPMPITYDIAHFSLFKGIWYESVIKVRCEKCGCTAEYTER